MNALPADRDQLATKADLAELRSELRSELYLRISEQTRTLVLAVAGPATWLAGEQVTGRSPPWFFVPGATVDWSCQHEAPACSVGATASRRCTDTW
jgi:hypothetical protein